MNTGSLVVSSEFLHSEDTTKSGNKPKKPLSPAQLERNRKASENMRGTNQSEESRKKRSESLKAYYASEENRQKHKEKIANRDPEKLKAAREITAQKNRGKKRTEEQRQRMSEAAQQPRSEAQQAATKLAQDKNRGSKWTDEQRQRLSQSLRNSEEFQAYIKTMVGKWSGEKNPSWRQDRDISKDLKWARRQAMKLYAMIKDRGGNNCIICHATEKLEVDHILPIRAFPELATTLWNMRTLCKPCHMGTLTYAGRGSWIDKEFGYNKLLTIA